MHPDDAERLGIRDDDELEVTSRRGAVTSFAKVTTRVAPGNVFMSFHFPEVKVNLLTSGHSDAATRCPEYKISAVKLTRLGAGDGRALHGAAGMHHVE